MTIVLVWNHQLFQKWISRIPNDVIYAISNITVLQLMAKWAHSENPSIMHRACTICKYCSEHHPVIADCRDIDGWPAFSVDDTVLLNRL